MKKRVVSLLLVFALVFTLIPASAVTAFAASYSGTVNGVNWSIDEDGVLTISPGTATDTYKYGEMGDMDSYSYSGWKMVGCSELVTKIVIKDGVTGIGDYAFYNMPNVTVVVMADSVEFIGDYAFFY